MQSKTKYNISKNKGRQNKRRKRERKDKKQRKSRSQSVTQVNKKKENACCLIFFRFDLMTSILSSKV